MQRRIFGIETEYGITCSDRATGRPAMEAEAAARELFASALRQSRSTNLFLPNGGRLYLDVGAHPEYATAECDQLWDLLAQIRAGAQILADMAQEGDQRLLAAGTDASIHLFGNNQDYEGNSYGCHENYMLRRSRDFRDVADSLVAFFVTRQIVVGAGDLRRGEDGEVRYLISSRADRMQDAVSAATTRSRPIINTRDEPLGDASSYRRLHVIVGDTNVAEPTTALKVASADLVLGAVEQGVNLSDLELENPMTSIREIAADLDGQALLELKDGRRMTAAQIQTEILERALSKADEVSMNDLYRYLIDLWQRATHAYASGDWSSIDTEIDYAIKKKLIDGYIARSGVPLSDSRITRLILAYHDITGAGLAPKMEQSGLVRRLTSNEQVITAMESAPATTRASLRGGVIRAAQDARRDLGVDWVNLRLDGRGLQIALQDPFATEDSRVDELISIIMDRKQESSSGVSLV